VRNVKKKKSDTAYFIGHVTNQFPVDHAILQVREHRRTHDIAVATCSAVLRNWSRLFPVEEKSVIGAAGRIAFLAHALRKSGSSGNAPITYIRHTVSTLVDRPPCKIPW